VENSLAEIRTTGGILIGGYEMTKIIALSPEWHKARSKAIGSTESSALFGISPYTTKFELWHRKHDGVIVEIEDNDRMKWGRRLEAPIAEGIAEDLDIKVEPFKEYLTHPDEPHMGSSFDYRIVGGAQGDGLMEIKNVDGLVYRKTWTEDEAPKHIEAQVQHEMEVAGLDYCMIVALVGGNDPKVIWRNRDRDMGAKIRRTIGRFWKTIEANKPPKPDFEQDAEFIISLHQSAGIKILEADEELADMLAQYANHTQAMKLYDNLKKELKAKILDKVGDEYNKVIAEGFSLSLTMTKTTPPTVITEDMVGQTYGGRKGYRQFRLTEKKGGKK